MACANYRMDVCRPTVCTRNRDGVSTSQLGKNPYPHREEEKESCLYCMYELISSIINFLTAMANVSFHGHNWVTLWPLGSHSNVFFLYSMYLLVLVRNEDY